MKILDEKFHNFGNQCIWAGLPQTALWLENWKRRYNLMWVDEKFYNLSNQCPRAGYQR
jgi:hypothetical protein